MRTTIGMTLALALGVGPLAGTAHAGDVFRKIDAEVDPVAPASANYEQQKDGVTTQKWGGNVDFNMAGLFSTGPELWVGNFTVTGPKDPSQTYRREDFYPGESQRLDAIRLRWNFTAWELPGSMRGWYMKTGYSYTRINSKANRFLQTAGVGDALPANVGSVSPDDNTELVTDIRHGVFAGFGNRWLFADQKFSVTLGASITTTFKRQLVVDGKDPNGLADYNQLIETLPDTRMSTRPTPEANLSLGYAL